MPMAEQNRDARKRNDRDAFKKGKGRTRPIFKITSQSEIAEKQLTASSCFGLAHYEKFCDK